MTATITRRYVDDNAVLFEIDYRDGWVIDVRRFEPDDAKARLRSQIDQLQARRDEITCEQIEALIEEHPDEAIAALIEEHHPRLHELLRRRRGEL